VHAPPARVQGHAAMLARCSSISEESFLVAAEALAAMANPIMVRKVLFVTTPAPGSLFSASGVYVLAL